MNRSFTRWTALAAMAVASLSLCAHASAETAKKHILVVTHTTGFRHGDSIPVAEGIIKDLGDKSGLFDVDYARNADDVKQKMTADALKGYDAVFFCQTTGDLGLPDKQAFLDWIKAGHGFIGTHSATDTYHNWPEYIDMIGGEFQGHGAQVEVEVNVEDPNFPGAAALPADMQKSFKVKDEIYEFKPTSFSREKSHVILSMSKHPQNGTPGDYWTSWCRSYGQGRVFYMALGHRPDVWNTDWYQQYLLGGIKWALGLAPGSSTPSGPLPAAIVTTT
ncbi:MAG: ThuA domain-containing protein, partial [Armatimonadota bacterium]|nr:ThuA domain-containing protein [Armatimonadota bacterium]